MAALLDTVIDYSPADDQQGVPLRSTITVQFSEEMDEQSVPEAIFVEGPDTDTVVGPNSSAEIHPSAFGRLLGEEPDYLNSPGYKGIVTGEFTYEVNGDGTLATFTPAQALAALTHYVVHITDLYQRSIADTVAGGSNTGNGEVTFLGTWVGTADSVCLRITKAGTAGVAEFEWWMAGDPFNTHGPILTSRREALSLAENLYVKFDDGSFAVDDEYSAALTTAILHSGHLTFEFDTGSGAIQALPSTSSSSIISALRQESSSSLSAFTVSKTTPADHSAQASIDLPEIVIEFNKNIDETSIVDEDIIVLASMVSNHPALLTMEEKRLAIKTEVSGKKLLIKI
jgi:hypothetical protein